jgi:hypothetical protein
MEYQGDYCVEHGPNVQDGCERKHGLFARVQYLRVPLFLVVGSLSIV